MSANRGKRSIAVNMRDPEGVEIIQKLAADADVLIHNMREKAVANKGLDYETLKKINPRLIYCHTRGFELGLVVVEVGLVLQLEAHRLEPVRRGVAQHHRVVLQLVPALHEDSVAFVRRFDQSDDLGVIRRRQLQVRHPDLNMAESQDPHQLRFRSKGGS